MATWWVRVYRGNGLAPWLHELEAETLHAARNWASDFLVDDDEARGDVVYLYRDSDGPALGHLYWGEDRLIHWAAARAASAAHGGRRPEANRYRARRSAPTLAGSRRRSPRT